MKPTILELNKKLAEYEYEGMDFTDVCKMVVKGKRIYCYLECDSHFIINNYTESLDAQIPIIDKLELIIHIDICRLCKDDKYIVTLKNFTCSMAFEGKSENLSEASAYALYYAIERSEEKWVMN